MRVLVVTVVHHPSDARIFHREIAALLEAGHSVTYAAPFTATQTPFPVGVRALDLPRAAGRARLQALRSARALIHTEATHHDLILIHDPELLLAVRGIRQPMVVWDVHEDTAAAVSMKSWIPKLIKPAVARAIRIVERRVEGTYKLLLAEDGYVSRFELSHPVVPNSTRAPDSVMVPGDERIVYVGALTAARGVNEMIELARILGPAGPRLHLVGGADAPSSIQLQAAVSVGLLDWHGFLPNAQALAITDGALAGLSLLRDEPNYRHSRPTKIIEYMAHAVPVITTPNPAAQALVTAADCGFVVPFEDPAAVAAAIHLLAADPDLRANQAARGRAVALDQYDWRRDGAEFARILESWTQSSGARR